MQKTTSIHFLWPIRILWWLGGADPSLLQECPRRERRKFLIIGILNVVYSAIVCYFWSLLNILFSEFHAESIVRHVVSVLALAASTMVFRGLMRTLSARSAEHSGASVELITALIGSLLFVLVLAGAVTAQASTLILVYFNIGFQTSIDSLAIHGFFFVLGAFILAIPFFMQVASPSEVYSRVYLRDRRSAFDESGADTGPSEPPAATSMPSSSYLERLEAGLEKDIESDPDDVATLKHLLDVKQQLRKYDDVFLLYDRLIRLDPNNVELWRAKAEVYRLAGDERNYVATLQEVAAIQERGAFLENRKRKTVVKEFSVHKIDFFGDFSWKLQPKVNVLLGKNGYGKTHILRAIVATLQNNDEISREFFTNAGRDCFLQTVVDHAGSDSAIRRTTTVFEKSVGKIPVLAIPDMRYVDKSRSDIPVPAEKWSNLLEHGAAHFLYQAPYDGLILDFYYRVCVEYFDKKKSLDIPMLKFIESVIGELAENPFKVKDIVAEGSRFRMEVLTDGNENNAVPLQKASQGTLSVVAMFGLVYSYLRAVFSDVPADRLTEQHAIVVIDEIDAHLHPSWQKKILDLFRRKFPNIQFIVTAHSPLVVAGCKEYEVAVLRREKDKPGFQIKTMSRHFIGTTAEEMYRTVFEMEEDHDYTYLRLDAMYSQKQEIQDRISELKKRVQSDPGLESELEELRARNYYIGQYEEVKAKKELQNDLKSQNDLLRANEMVLNDKVVTLSETVDDLQSLEKQTLKEVETFLERETNAAAFAVKIADILVEKGRLDNARSLMERALKRHPDDLHILRGLGAIYIKRGKYEQAADYLSQAARYAPEDPGVQSELRRVQQYLNNRAAAAES